VCLRLNRHGCFGALSILRHLTDGTLGMNAPSLVALLINPSTPDGFLISLLLNSKSRRLPFANKVLTQSRTFHVVADQC
jgi:hypothetical protein